MTEVENDNFSILSSLIDLLYNLVDTTSELKLKHKIIVSSIIKSGA